MGEVFSSGLVYRDWRGRLKVVAPSGLRPTSTIRTREEVLSMPDGEAKDTLVSMIATFLLQERGKEELPSISAEEIEDDLYTVTRKEP